MRTLPELRAAAEEGRLREVPGIGPATERKLLAALAREPARVAPRPLTLNRSRPLVESIAEALRRRRGRRPAALARRVRAAGRRLLGRTARAGARPVRGAAADRHRRRARLPSRTSASRSREFPSSSSSRRRRASARSSSARPAHPSGWRALEPLPDAADEEGVFRALGIPFAPPELREDGFRGEPRAAARARGRPRRPALPHGLVRRACVGVRDGARGAGARLRLPRDLRSHGQRRRGHRPRRGRRAAAG